VRRFLEHLQPLLSCRAGQGYTPAMHWFWRAAIAVFLSTTVFIVVLPFLSRQGPVHSSLKDYLGVELEVWLVLVFPCSVSALAAYGLLTRDFASQSTRAGETCCRKCGYILRGISEPRCPECGERI